MKGFLPIVALCASLLAHAQNISHEMTYRLLDMNWAGLMFNDSNDHPYFYNIYMGLQDYYYTTDSIKRTKVRLNFNREGTINMKKLHEKIEAIKKTIPTFKRPLLLTKIYIDENIPLVHLQYLQIMLAKSGMLKVGFVNNKEEILLTKLSPYLLSSDALFSPFSMQNETYYSSFCAPYSNHHDPTNYKWVPHGPSVLDEVTFMYMPSVIDIDPKWSASNIKNEIQINLDQEGKIQLNGNETTIEKLRSSCYQELSKRDKGDELYFIIRAEQQVAVGKYLAVLASVKLAYLQKWNELSEELYGLPYSELTDNRQIRTIRLRFPLAIRECLY